MNSLEPRYEKFLDVLYLFVLYNQFLYFGKTGPVGLTLISN